LYLSKQYAAKNMKPEIILVTKILQSLLEGPSVNKDLVRLIASKASFSMRVSSTSQVGIS
jgi:hypothetical protein